MEQVKVLLIEDDSKIASLLIRELIKEGFAVDHFTSGEEGVAAAGREGANYGVCILDLMLPGIDGIQVIKELRSRECDFPVLILSAKRSVDERVHGLKSGGDDYLTKPFSIEELLARVQALIRRSAGTAHSEATTLVFEDLTLDRVTRNASRMGKPIELQPREFLLLALFMSDPGRIFSKNLLLEKIWGYSFDPQTNVVDVLVCRLRAKIDGPFSRKLIETVRGVGYVFGKSEARLQAV